MFSKKIKTGFCATLFCIGLQNVGFADNPFVDVPADHWAYESIAKLEQAGVVEGYGDNTYRGNRLMTRYEMAQIVARAMSKGAKVDKLAAEFKEELDGMGYRVSDLEKKQDNVTITGDVRAHFAALSGTSSKPGVYNSNRTEKIRTRLTVQGKINDNWDYVGRIENNHDLDTQNIKTTWNQENTLFQNAYLKGRIGGVTVKAGRFDLVRDVDGNIYDNRFDGIALLYGNKYKIGGYYGKPTAFDASRMPNRIVTNTVVDGEGWQKSYGVNFSAELGKTVSLITGYDSFIDNENGFDDNHILSGGIKYHSGKVSLGLSGFKSDSDTARNKHGVVASFKYNAALAKKPHSWDFIATYYKLGDGVNIVHTMNGDANLFTERYKDISGGGFKGFQLGIHYVLAKNMVLGFEHYNLKGISNSDFTAKTFWTEVRVFF